MLSWQHVSNKLRMTTMPRTAAFLLLVAAVPVWMPAKESEQAFSMPAVEGPLAENWVQVADLLKSATADTPAEPDPVVRLIMGHACLALYS